MDHRYLLITPCRDEASHARTTLASVLRQSIPPAKWIIVDDGSTDQTPRILAEYERKYDFITVIRRTDRGMRRVGPGVIDAFYTGYEATEVSRYSYICKLDLDLDLPPRYFEELIKRMEADERLGTCSGKPYFRSTSTGMLVSEKCGDDMSVGMVKFYRTACFKEIGGFVREVMWDGIDCHRCRMHGWRACSWDDPEIRFLHLRAMGSSEKGIWSGRVRHGIGQYFMGTSPAYMAMSALYRMTRPPLVVGGLAMLWGYLRSMLARMPQYDDPDFRQFVRWYQRNVLLLGKPAAIRRAESRRRNDRGVYQAVH